MRIFLSHKATRDKECAERIKNALEGLERDKIGVFVSSADIAAAERWPKRIREELREADLLLLLYTDPNLDWATAGTLALPGYAQAAFAVSESSYVLRDSSFGGDSSRNGRRRAPNSQPFRHRD